MSRFATRTQSSARTTRQLPSSMGPNPKPTRTGNGAVGYVSQDAHFELFSVAVTATLGDNFYEKADATIKRIASLVPRCDPLWLQELIPWLRKEAGLRSVSTVLAAEYARNWQEARSVVSSALQRADEPAEFIAYWQHATKGRAMGGGVKRGVADAVQRLYTERSLLRYDGQNKAWRFGDVIEFVHPKPADSKQADLFRYALDRRRGVTDIPSSLQRVQATMAFEAVPQESRSTDMFVSWLNGGKAVISWERASSWLGRPLTAEDWAALLPTMGIFAVVRNLNNFVRSGATKAKVFRNAVVDILDDREKIRESGILPFQFVTAYDAQESDEFKGALSRAAEMAIDNIPAFKGWTLIMVDRSGSMDDAISGGRGAKASKLKRSYAAGFIAEAIARRCEKFTVVAYNSSAQTVDMLRHGSVALGALRKEFTPSGGTYTWACTERVFSSGMNRVFIITDEQTSDRDTGRIKVPVVTWNVAGYEAHHTGANGVNRFHVAGFNDKVLSTLPHLLGGAGKWPWEVASE